MSLRPKVPAALTRGPFTLEEARRAGLTRDHLSSGAWRRIGPRTYVRATQPATPLLALRAAWRRLPAEAAFSGSTAAWLHGLEAEPCDPIDVTVPKLGGVSARSGVTLHRADLQPSEVVAVHDLRVTSIVRTLADLGRRLPVIDGVVLVDAALNKQLLALTDIEGWLVEHSRYPGTARLRRVVDMAEPKSESPMETRLRLLLVLNGLPRPEAQVNLLDDRGNFLGRPDLLYRDARLVLEYDGGQHRDQLVEDNRRQNKLVNAGYRILRFTAADVLANPQWVIEQVRNALAARAAA